MGLNCAICPNHCCGKSDLNPPILMPYEQDMFEADHKTTIDGKTFRLKKNPDTGFCTFLDKDQRCTIYDKRPLECKLYPFIMQYDLTTKKLRLELHGLCPQKEEARRPDVPDATKLLPEEFWVRFMNQPL